MDTVFFLPPQESVYIQDTWKRGSHSNELPTVPCALQEGDTVSVVLDSSLTFIGDFRDEYRWDESFSAGRSSVQVCTFTISNADFVE